jgi:hypothetical protein
VGRLVLLGWGRQHFLKYLIENENVFLFWNFLRKPQPKSTNRLTTSSLLYFYFYKYIDFGLLHNGFGKNNANKEMQTKTIPSDEQ